MVKNRFARVLFLALFCFCGLTSLQAEPFVDASIDSMNSQAHFPLQGTITITHDKEERIDPQSFVLEGQSLETSLVKDVKMSVSSDTWVSIYNFQLPAKEKGLYILPSISVKIGGKTYHSSPSSFGVHAEGAAQPSPASSVSTPSSSPTLFRLEASIQGPTILYPGERTKLFYRILYNRNVDLTRSELPMVHPTHFRKIGDVQIKDYQLKETTVQDLTQEVEASELGIFSFGPSMIEGYAYTMQAGQKVYDSTPLTAKAPIVSVEVKPFPSRSQPASFTGALGKIEAKASLSSSHTLAVGDTLQVKVEIKGITNLNELHLPSLQCQPGFSGFFQTSDIPPLSEVKGETKLFYVELRPLTAMIDQIPAIEVSSFDPGLGDYLIRTTSPIPVTITASPLSLPSHRAIPLLMSPLSIAKWPAPRLSSLELQGNISLQHYTAYSWQKGIGAVWAMMFAIVLLLLQKYGYKKWQERPKPQVPPSEKLFKQALKKENLHLLEQAFWQRLWEKGIVPKGAFRLDRLPSEGKLAPISSFLFQLQALQYSANRIFNFSQLQSEAKERFDAI